MVGIKAINMNPIKLVSIKLNLINHGDFGPAFLPLGWLAFRFLLA